MRLILENSRTEYISLEQEIMTLEFYLDLQQQRFKNRFQYHITVDQELDPEEVLLPPMLTQPFIENSIEHGLKDKTTEGLIEIKFYRKLENLVVQVLDNGVGFEASLKSKTAFQSKHRSMAMSITSERLALLNRKRKKNRNANK